MHNDHEKRKYERIEKLFMARMQIKRHEGHKKGSTGWDSVTLHNLSEGGTFFIYKKDLGIGTLLDLKIDVPGFILIINCVGKVIRIDKPKSTSMYSIAIKLIDIGEQEKEAIYTAVEEALEQANKTSLT